MVIAAMSKIASAVPLITTLVKASGLFIYFSVAHFMVAQLH
jgi:Mg/Co/Ni transporter MgtE